MSTRRRAGTSCPMPPRPVVSMDLCQPCPYFRGAGNAGMGWTITCNWPRHGAVVWTPPIPLDDFSADEIRRRSA